MISILCIILSLELSFANGMNEYYELPDEKPINEYIEDSFYITVGTEVFVYNDFYIKGSAKIFLYAKDTEFSCFPMTLSSYFEMGYIMNGLKIGWRHFCTHPLVPYFGNNTFLKFYDESGDEFFIRYETEKLKIF